MNNHPIVINSKQAKKRALDAVQACMSDTIMQVSIEPYKDNKTAAQRKWWHTMLGMLGKELGYTLPEIKDIIKVEVIGMQHVEWKGLIVDRIPSSEDEKRAGYSHLIEETYRIAAEQGCVLPDPHYKE
jgi:hypothetical protein